MLYTTHSTHWLVTSLSYTNTPIHYIQYPQTTMLYTIQYIQYPLCTVLYISHNVFTHTNPPLHNEPSLYRLTKYSYIPINTNVPYSSNLRRHSHLPFNTPHCQTLIFSIPIPLYTSYASAQHMLPLCTQKSWRRLPISINASTIGVHDCIFHRFYHHV